jgi:hypothetical protein
MRLAEPRTGFTGPGTAPVSGARRPVGERCTNSPPRLADGPLLRCA